MPYKTHGHCVGKRGYAQRSPTYNSWRAMRERCFSKTNINYKNYGAKGVTVCQQWESFECFLEDMGERPEGHVLSRFKDEGNYEPGNVSWKLLKDNVSEKKHAVGSIVGISKLTENQVLKIREFKEKGYGIRELSRIYKVDHKTISAIIKKKTWKHI